MKLLPMIDKRRRVRLWDKDWQCTHDLRIQPDETPFGVVSEIMREQLLVEVRATVDDEHGDRVAAIFYRDSDGAVQFVSYDEIRKLFEWPKP
ncbi:MAG TPA: hypothetical protein VHE33_20780 [Acidobacteriaceae bacterium]|jgi:hypothetical protein|nr:hypothetical protein [Acidobacteriaceae bacterium]